MKTIRHSLRIPGAILHPHRASIAVADSVGWGNQFCQKPHWLKPLVILCCLANPLAAGQFGKFTYTDNGTEITITDYPNGEVGTIAIPASIIGKPVTRIGDRAFEYCSKLTGVTIPGSVTEIGDSAFESCVSLTGIAVPNRVSSIGERAFTSCYGLTSAAIGSHVASIGNSAFESCISLTSITIPGSVTSIGSKAFFSCYGLTDLTIGNGVARIGESAFESCINLISVTIPDSATDIGDDAFAHSYGLTAVTIGERVTSIAGSAFDHCGSLTSITVDLRNQSYSSLSGVLFNKSRSQLIRCPGGKNGKYPVPNGVTSIADGAFESCNNLTSVTIPSSVASIGGHAFRGCGSLTAITVHLLNPSYSSESGVLFNKGMGELIQYPGGKAGSYSIPNSASRIGDEAFQACSRLTSVVIPNHVTRIGDRAFESCGSLTGVTVGNRVASVGNRAFYACSSLTSITIPDSVTNIGDSAFGSCEGLIRIAIGNGVASIGDGAFADCSGLTGIIIPNRVSSIACSVFRGCHNLTSVTIPPKVTHIGSSAFEDCSSLTNITIPACVTNIGKNAFSDCGKLKSMFFLGNAPIADTSILAGCAPGLTVYYSIESVGFSSPEWMGCASAPLLANREISVTGPRGGELTDGEAVVNFNTIYPGDRIVKILTIHNAGITPLSGLAILRDGLQAAGFTVSSLDATELAPAAKTSFTVTFNPRTNGVHTASIRIASNDSDEDPFDIVLSGTLSPRPEIVVRQSGGNQLEDGVSASSFGGVAVHSSVDRTFIIRNTGTEKLKDLAVTKTGRNADSFIVSDPLKTSLAPGASTTFRVIFKPSAKGSLEAIIRIHSNDGDENPFDIPVVGKGLASHSHARLAESTISLPGIYGKSSAGNRPVVSVVRVEGGKFRCLTVFRESKTGPGQESVEVSSNLVDWFSGPEHTTVIEDSAELIKVRDNTPIEPGVKRFIRLRE